MNPKITNESLWAIIRRKYNVEAPNYIICRVEGVTLLGQKSEHTIASKFLRQCAKIVAVRILGSMVSIQRVTPTLGEPHVFKRMFLRFYSRKRKF